MADLVSGGYAESNPFQALTGGLTNATQANVPAYTNATWFGVGNYTDTATGFTTAKSNGYAVPVDLGVTISNVTILVGAAAGTITHWNWSLYSGIAVPAKLNTQSVDVTSTPLTANTFYTVALGKPFQVTPASAPNGFLYVGLSLTASVAPSVASATTPTAIVWSGAAGFSTSAPVFAANYTGGGAVAPATLAAAGAATVAAAPFIWLT
jgi:hypothetical protein